MSHFSKIRLLATTAPLTLAFAAPAWAQQDPATTSTSPVATANAASQDTATTEVGNSGDIVVTGSILRRTDTETPSPVTIVTAESLDQRGISTIQDGIQQLASNNGPALTNSFTANGAFAAGASAVSLRGLSTNSTLVLFDGLRAAYYPLADDGSRNFVDLNTIPDDIIERIEVLRDGASSSYGADAIAGVVNLITKKEFKGVGGRAEAGISQKGDAAQQRLTLTAGYGDLEDQGFNAYVSGFYYRSEALLNKDRKYPYNSDDQRGVCASDGTCGPNLTIGGRNGPGGTYVGGTPTASIFYVRPADATNTNLIAGTRYQTLGNSCPGTTLTLTAAEIANAANATAPAQICNADYTNLYGTITPNIERFGASARLTARIGDTIEAYGMVNFIQSRSSYYSAAPATIRGLAPTGILYPQFGTDRAPSSTTTADTGILALPVYVCPRNGRSATLVNGVPTFGGGCTATTPGATLNPNNPFAAAGQTARLVGRDLSQTPFNETRNRAYRAAFGVSGNITDGISFDVGATAMHNDLRRNQEGYVYIQRLLDVVADGSYNFRNPSANSAAVQDYLMPSSRNDSSSDQYQLQATIGFTPFTLPGGSLQIGVGGSIRYEAVDSPSGNDDYNGPTQRYFTLNAFGTTGSRRIYSGFAELSAPIFDQFEIDASGRYDKYSSGQDSFSPKIGAKFKPIRQVLIRGTYSKGFRIPSFGEANALPTTGYVTNGVSLFNNAYLAQYSTPGNVCSTTTFAACPAYIRGSYGLTTLASPNLQPEKSRSFTGGLLLEPIRGVSFTVDYYNIRKTGGITNPQTGPAIQAYYAGTAIDPAITIIPDAPDVNFPNAKPRVAFAQAQLINADVIKAQGLDFTGTVNHDFGTFKLASSVEASYILRLSTNDERYDGTLGNFNLTAGSGTPKWHGSWQNTFDFGDFAITGTANYFDKYNLSAQDQGDDYKDCAENPGYSPVGCNVDAYITVDLNASIKINDKFTFYGTVLNLLNDYPPIDVVTYGANLYNPVQGGLGILGRYFKAGVKVGF